MPERQQQIVRQDGKLMRVRLEQTAVPYVGTIEVMEEIEEPLIVKKPKGLERSALAPSAKRQRLERQMTAGVPIEPKLP